MPMMPAVSRSERHVTSVSMQSTTCPDDFPPQCVEVLQNPSFSDWVLIRYQMLNYRQ
jgi:hypothetical protein